MPVQIAAPMVEEEKSPDGDWFVALEHPPPPPTATDTGDNCTDAEIRKAEEQIRFLEGKISDVSDEKANHERWIMLAKEAIAKVEGQIVITTESTQQLQQTIDTLETQKRTIANKIKRDQLQHDLDEARSSLTKLKTQSNAVEDFQDALSGSQKAIDKNVIQLKKNLIDLSGGQNTGN